MAAARPELNRLEILRALRISNWEAVCSTAHLTLTGGAFQTGFAIWLGASSFWLGVLGAVPTLAGLAQLVSPWFIERRGERRQLTAWFSGAARLLWLPILLIPWLVPSGGQWAALILLAMISALLLNAPIPAFLSWMSDLVPPEHRGHYFGRRNMIAGITTMLISLPAASFLDLATRKHRFPPSLGFAGLFGFACLCGIASLLLLLRQQEPPLKQSGGTAGLSGTLELYRQPLADPGFRPFLVYLFIFSAAQFFAGPFFTAYALEQLRLDYVWLQVFATVSGLATLLSIPMWGYLSDKFGARPLLSIAVAGVCMMPLGWVFTWRSAPVETIAVLIATHLFGGAFWAGVNLTQFNLLIGIAPEEKRPVYVGAAAAVTAISGGLSPVLAGAILTGMNGYSVRLGGLVFGSFQLLFVMNALMRLAALANLRRVTDPGAASAREVLSQIGGAQVLSWRHIRRLKQASTEEDRRAAAQALGNARTALAVEELVAALDDPSLHVREEAAQALGEIGDARAVDALAGHLEDPASGMVAGAADALGRIGDPRAVDPLARLLRTGERDERVAAARALGRIGGEPATEPLLEALARCDQAEEVCEAAALALGSLGEARAAVPLAGLLTRAPRTLRLAAVRALGEIGEHSSAKALQNLLDSERDPAVIAHTAVALAMVGAREAVGPMLGCLDRLDSPLACRQIIHAAGTLIGEGEGFYALLGMDAFARDAAVSRMIRALTAHAATNEQPDALGERKRSRLSERALERYLEGRGSECLADLARLLNSDIDGGEPARIAFNWAVRTAESRGIQPEELLLAVYAASRIAARR